MKILIDEAIPFIKGRFPENIETCYMPGSKIDGKAARDADALIVRTRTRCDESLLKGSNVKLVVSATIGTDHIDTEWCKANGVTVRNAPGCNAPGVAQYVLASLFETGFDAGKHCLGIVGYGHVGSTLAKWARMMGIKTLISDAPRQNSGLRDVDYRPVEEVLRESDAVTLHVPLTKNGDFPTYKMISAREMEMMKPGAWLVNSSRGGVVDESAEKEYLKKGKLRGITDVWEKEPVIDLELFSLLEIATPHIAGYSAQGKKRATAMALQALKEELGVETDLKGLECVADDTVIMSPEMILDTYHPSEDCRQLRERPSDFEFLRNNYTYRQEPFFSE